MLFLLDTSIAIHLRDRDLPIIERIAGLDGTLAISVVTRIELEGGVHRDPRKASIRQARLEALLDDVATFAFDDDAAAAYGRIVAAAGYSRRKILDRMIAAQALVHRATLVTLNPADFADVPGLAIEDWSAPPSP